MKMVTVITGLVTKQAPYYGQNEMRMHRTGYMPSVSAGDGGRICDLQVETQVVPIIRFCKNKDGHRDDLYIAVSPETEELLGVPINTMHRELKDAQSINDDLRRLLSNREASLNAIRRAGVWGRLVYLFTKILPE